MSRYIITIELEEYATYRATQRIEMGWDPPVRKFFLFVHEEDTNIHSSPRDFIFWKPTFGELLEAVKRRNRDRGIRGLGTIGRQLKAFQRALEADQKDNVPHGDIFDGTATDLPDRPQITA